MYLYSVVYEKYNVLITREINIKYNYLTLFIRTTKRIFFYIMYPIILKSCNPFYIKLMSTLIV